MRLTGYALICYAALVFAALASHGEEVLYEQPIGRVPDIIPLTVQIGTERVLMGLDTGLETQAIDVSLRAASVGRRHPPVTFDVLGGHVSVPIVDIPSIRLGNWALPPGQAAVSDCLKFRRDWGYAFRGFIGAKPLGQVAIDVNYDEQRLRFVKDMEPPPNAQHFLAELKSSAPSYLPLTFVDNHATPFLTVDLEGVRLRMLVDMGSAEAITLRDGPFQQLVAAGAIVKSNVPDKGMNPSGPTSFQKGWFTRGEFLGLPLQGKKVIDSGTDNSVGMGLLGYFNFTVDLQGARFYFTPRIAPVVKPYGCLGLSFRYDEKGCYVRSVRAPDASKIQVGDAVLKLGPLAAAEMNTATVYQLCEEHYGETIDVEFRRPGEKRTRTTPLLVAYPIASPQPEPDAPSESPSAAGGTP